jgi:four helix bundle protein
MNNQPGYKGFTDLKCWQTARKLRKKISILVKSFPKEEKYMLVSQLLECSRSITNNISEGYGRYTYKDTRHFFIQARGSVTETIDQLIIAFDEKYITKEELLDLKIICEKTFSLINGYINYLDKQEM